LIIYIVVVILVNLAATTLFVRFDMTGDKLYSISAASRQAVASLFEPLTIKVFFTQKLPSPYNNTEQYLRDLLEEYAIYANKHFNYRFYDVSPEGNAGSETGASNRQLARNYGISPVQIRLLEKDEIKFKNAYMGLVLIHGDLIESIPTITSTEGLEYRLTTIIRKLSNKISALLALSEKIKIQLIMSATLKAVAPYMGLKDLPELPQQVARAVERLNSSNYGKLTFQYLDPTRDPNLDKLVAQHNLMRLKWPAPADGKIKAGQGVIGLLMAYGNKTVSLPLLRTIRIPLFGTRYELVGMDDLDTFIGENVESLIDINEDIGYLADHDTLDLSGAHALRPRGGQQGDVLSAFNALVSQNYSLKRINLKSEPIPDSLKSLIIARPQEKFSDFELYQIDQFLMRGKSLLFFMDVFKEVVPPGSTAMTLNRRQGFVPVETGLEKLLEHYGVRVQKAYVMDEICYKQTLPQQYGGGEQAIYFAPIIQRRFINDQLAFMKNIKALVAMRVAPLKLNDPQIKKNDITVHRLIASSDKSWLMQGQINLNPMFIRPPANADEKGSQPLAYLLEGQFPSYFDGRPIPEKKTDAKDSQNEAAASTAKEPVADKGPAKSLAQVEGRGVFRARSQPAKIFVLGSADMLKDNILDEAGRSPNAAFILNTLDHMNDRDDIAVMRGKEQRFNPLYAVDGPTKTIAKTFNIAGLPVLVVLFGLGVWWRRHAKKKYIRMMFQR